MRPRISVALAILAGVFLSPTATVSAQPDDGGDIVFRIGYLRAFAPRLMLSALDIPPSNEGLAGAAVAVADNNTTGKFLKQKFILDAVDIKPGDDATPVLQQMLARGDRYILTDISAGQLLAIADVAKQNGALLFNVGAPDDVLRGEECRENVLHIAPSRAMLADSLAQYLVWKQWRRWVLLYGSHEADKLYAVAIRRAADRFGARIVEEREYRDTGTARRTDSGVTQVQKQIPVFTQNLPEHDVVVVADESEVFGTYVPYRTWRPRPVAGTAGLRASSWHPASEQWGGSQIQSRFLKTAGRRMQSKDMQAWTAVRIIGEAATRTATAAPGAIEAFIKSDGFSVAAFKGQKLTFRNWNWQLRQPILLSDGRDIVSVSPQEGFLHQYSELDTLGVDRPETKCRFK